MEQIELKEGDYINGKSSFGTRFIQSEKRNEHSECYIIFLKAVNLLKLILDLRWLKLTLIYEERRQNKMDFK